MSFLFFFNRKLVLCLTPQWLDEDTSGEDRRSKGVCLWKWKELTTLPMRIKARPHAHSQTSKYDDMLPLQDGDCTHCGNVQRQGKEIVCDPSHQNRLVASKYKKTGFRNVLLLSFKMTPYSLKFVKKFNSM